MALKILTALCLLGIGIGIVGCSPKAEDAAGGAPVGSKGTDPTTNPSTAPDPSKGQRNEAGMPLPGSDGK